MKKLTRLDVSSTYVFSLFFVVTILSGLAISSPVQANAFPGANGKIAFVSNRDGNNEIYVMNADGSNQTRLTNNPADDNNPAWSPDGAKIAFTSDRASDPGIYIINADGSGQVLISSYNNGSFSWSPDGTKLAVRGSTGIWILDATNGANLHTISNDGVGMLDSFDTKPSWSPDGTKIAYVRQSLVDMSYTVWVTSATTYANLFSSVQVTPPTYNSFDPSWSPNGTRIAFATNQQTYLAGGFDLFFVNADGSGKTGLFSSGSNRVSHPSWSPDGHKIAFAFGNGGSAHDSQTDIYTVNYPMTNTNGLVNLTPNTTSSNDFAPDWQRIPSNPHNWSLNGGITASDLDISNVGTLPTSNWYVFKEWRRGISRFFTFGATAKAELELNIVNEKAAEILGVEQANPNNATGLRKAIANYTDAMAGLQTRLASLTETSKNPNVAKLLRAMDDKTTKHMELFTELTFKIADNESPDPAGIHVVAGDANGDGIPIVRTEGLTELVGDIKIVENGIQKTLATAIDKGDKAKEKAADEIVNAEKSITDILVGFAPLKPAEFLANLAGNNTWSNEAKSERVSGATDQSDLPSTYLVAATNGGVWKSITNAKDNLDRAKKAFADEKYGEAFGLARSAEVLANEATRTMAAWPLQYSAQGALKEKVSSDKKQTSEESTKKENKAIVPTTKTSELVKPNSTTETAPETTTSPAQNTEKSTVAPTTSISNTIEPETKIKTTPETTTSPTERSGTGGGAMGL